jgi:mannose-1-phosphate guanylyltransferase
MLHAIIIAGGSGKRLWPKSKRQSPKFFLKVKGKKSLLEETVNRAKGIMPLDNIMIITSIRHAALIRKILPNFSKKNIIAEPFSKNTGPAVCLGAAIINKKDPNAVIYIMPADQVIEDKHAITEVFKLASLISRIKDSIITIGIEPGFPSTGYGYIKTGKPYKSLKAKSAYDVYEVECFTEKPDLKKAKVFIKTKRYLWNSGIFIGKASVFLSEFNTYSRSVYNTVTKIASAKGKRNLNNALKKYYKDCPDISIDYAIMEKTSKAFVIKANPGWSDIGSWDIFQKYLPVDKNQNAVSAEHIGVDTTDSILIGEKGRLIATAGIKGLVIVQTKDATLVCSKKQCEEVKGLVDMAQKKGLERYI